ncbi:MAG TPA: hypothetical protein VJG83_00415 [archaeon]|nr:hypothetical protein [archaeon]
MNKDYPKVLFVFVLTYVALYIIGLLSPLKDWAIASPSNLDYMLWFVPATGFFFIYMLLPFAKSEFGFGKYFVYAFPVVFFVLSFLAYYVAIFWYYDNQAFLAGVDISLFNLNYWDLFLTSHFIYFVLAGIGGWGAGVLIDETALEGAKEK